MSPGLRTDPDSAVLMDSDFLRRYVTSKYTVPSRFDSFRFSDPISVRKDSVRAVTSLAYLTHEAWKPNILLVVCHPGLRLPFAHLATAILYLEACLMP